jgi:hypothetical protein
MVSCKEESLVGKWNLEYAEAMKSSKELMNKIAGRNSNAFVSKEKLPNNELVLKADSTYFYFWGSKNILISIGKWAYDTDSMKIYLTPVDNTLPAFTLNIQSKVGNKLKTIVSGDDYTLDFMEFNYKKANKNAIDPKNDYTTFAMNEWRINAKHKESEREIKNRLRGALQFACAYLQAQVDSKESGTRTNFLTSIPIRLASNGIAVKKDDRWESLFFDEEDAEMSYTILDNSFRKNMDIYIPDDIKKKPMHLNIFFLTNLMSYI